MLHHRVANRAAFHAYGIHRARPRTRVAVAERGEGPGLLVSPAFWIGGILSVAIWAGIFAAFKLF